MQPDIYRFIEIKDVSEDGTFNGIASAYGVEDLGGDVIDKGAFKKTIAENPTIPILWQHDPSEVIGEGTVKEWQGKILLSGKLDMEDPVAQKAYRKMKGKLIKGLSIGFNTIKSTWEDVEGRMVRHIGELKLWEVSVVTFPMLPSAQVTSVKSTEDLDARIRALEAKIEALSAPPPADPTPSGAGSGEGAAPVVPPQPAEDHSALSSRLDAVLAQLS